MDGFRRWLGKAVDCLLRKRSGQARTPSRGELSERLAADYLRKHGLRILGTNHRCKGGEIDLIAEEANSIVFVEVRLRSHPCYGSAAESITRSKQGRVVLAARHWLNGPGIRHAKRPCRFDAVLLDELDASRCEWIRDAFSGSMR